jgi:hypothetical protein
MIPKIFSNPAAQKLLILQGLIGILVGVFILHPLSEYVYFIEYRIEGQSEIAFILRRLFASLKGHMLPLTIGYGLLGGMLGVVFALLTARLAERNHLIRQLTEELGNSIRVIINDGETARVEFKSSFRWDNKQQKVNNALEVGVLKTLAGFMNGQGGILLIGVADDSEVLGLDHDYMTLKKRDRDGFEQAIMIAVSNKMGAQFTSLLQIVFHIIEDKEICQIIVAASPRPVYFRQGKEKIFYLRAGTSTRVLNIQEGVDYIQNRFKR